ncbi:MAG TPA: uracil-DNA glycosylase family protein [Thermoleophilia bacterium]|nr:uracil-DNA glycosylase family protein [Thermoleophilia bacterium]
MAQPNEIYDKYLTRAISEINELTGEILRCSRCSHARTMPVIGSGHPMADIFLLKYQARPSELHEGVAFFGRAGTALMKSCQRLKIDPLQLYGTNVIKCGEVREAHPEAKCLDHLRRELAIVNPKLIVAMGEETVAALNTAKVPLARELEYAPGEIVDFTPGTEVLVTPDIDVSLDEQRLKAGFWRAFRRLGEWYDNIPPY